MDRTVNLDAAELAHQAAWLRRLARGLLADGGEDVAQEAWLQALVRPPPGGVTRAWLSVVARNLARKAVRTARRRSGREAEAVAAVAAPPADELLARHEAQRVLAELVSQLDEPYRSTVLLHYVEDLALIAIARREGIHAATVRWRLKHARDELRRRLEARYGTRRAWAVALGPVARESAAHPGAAIAGPVKLAMVGAGVVAALVFTATRQPVAGGWGEAAAAFVGAPAAGPGSAGTRAVGDEPRPPGPPRFLPAAHDDARADARPDIPRTRPPEVLALHRRHDFTQDELLALASNCETRQDVPGMKTRNDMFQGWMEEHDLESLGLDVHERRVVWTAAKRFRAEMTAALRALYLAVTDDAEGARTVDLMDFGDERDPRTARFLRRMDARHFMDGSRIVAEEIAGLDPAPSRFDERLVSLAADFYRTQRTLADDFERQLRAELGPERARQIRRGGVAGHTRRPWCP